MQTVQETLFDPNTYLASESALARSRIIGALATFEVLGYGIDALDVPSQYMRIKLMDPCRYYDTGYNLFASEETTYTNEYLSRVENKIFWQPGQSKRESVTGHMIGVHTMRFSRQLIAHVLRDCTDIENSYAVPLDNIESIDMYSDEQSEMVAAFSNAVVDGTFWIGDFYDGLNKNDRSTWLEPDEILPFLRKPFWKEPQNIYTVD